MLMSLTLAAVALTAAQYHALKLIGSLVHSKEFTASYSNLLSTGVSLAGAIYNHKQRIRALASKNYLVL